MQQGSLSKHSITKYLILCVLFFPALLGAQCYGSFEVFGAGSNYNFNERVGVHGMAVLQRHLQNLNTAGPARLHPWQATLEVGVRVFVDPR